ncbi:MAG: histidine kinase dimerization/phosphoacceptor domain -containing protein [Balneolaceae bacterium]|nr:histidine kinase dimerization/phosphoacceptor domain -containing protein [Balneolaceae bacterium]
MDENQSSDFQNNENLNHLLELIGQINSNLEINDVLQNIIEAAKTITNSEASSVFLLDKETDELILTVPTGPVREKVHGQRFPKDQGIAGWVATNAKAQIVNDVSSDERFYGDFDPGAFTTRNILCVPMKNQSEEVIGVLQAINKKNGAGYRDSEVYLFQALAHQAAIAITNTRLHDERKTLLSEIHHRVKNNMAIISGLIQLEALNEPDEAVQRKLLKSVTRISSMAAVHEQLYESESLSRLNYKKNLKKVVQETIQTLSALGDISVSYECEPVVININQSIPCSLIVSEVIYFLAKFGFQEVEDPAIIISLFEKEKEDVQVNIQDNGTSIKKYLTDEEGDGVGFQLIQVLSRQLEAEFDYTEGDAENKFTLRFSKSDRGGAGSHFL